jgi:hypothetical protein
MALTLDELRRLADAVDFRYFIDPKSPTLLCSAQGRAGSYQFVMSLQIDGKFLQFRTLQYQRCAAGHAHLGAVLRVLAEINTQLRFIKFGWDASEGEILVFADVWLMDAGLTEQQFRRLLSNFLPAIDEQYPRISQTIATGRDPGPIASGSAAPAAPPDVERI